MGTAKCTLDFTYGTKTATFLFHADSQTYTAAGTKTAGDLRNAISGLFETQSRGTSIHVTKHYSSTPAKLGGSIHQSARVVYEITIPVSMAGHDDNGGLTALTVAKDSTAEDTKFSVAMYQMGDNSEAIANALTSLPNSVIPGVTVTKGGVTDSDTNSAGSSGNAYAQSYAITFNNEANAGDQNMLSCNAAPCDEDGCLNRGTGVSEVRYMRHDPENHGEGINFVSQGYFIMDIGVEASVADLSAGSIKIMWDTGSGISSAIFAVVATASEVQTALRTITGWEGVTVELWGSRAKGTSAAAHILKAHQFKVTFAAGYDDMGKSPTFYTMTPSDGAYAVATDVRAELYDQRFSNSIWLGKTTGYFEAETDAASATTLTAKFTPVGGDTVTLVINPQPGDVYYVSKKHFGAGADKDDGADLGDFPVSAGDSKDVTHFKTGSIASVITAVTAGNIMNHASTTAVRFAYLKRSVTSRQTSDYFAVGSTVEVLPSTWDSNSNPQTDNTLSSNNKYRKFKVTGHVTNQFNTEFAKLDSFPVEESLSAPTGTASSLPDYNLRITSNNGTVHSYESKSVKVTLEEKQVLSLGHGIDYDMKHGSGQWDNTYTYKLSYKGELSQDMDVESTPVQIAEEIKGFSALSGAVTVTGEGTATSNGGYPKYIIKFNATVTTRENGWSIEGPLDAGLETMQAGGTINITAQETCTFTHASAGAGTAYYFCYDGVCGP